MNKSDLLKSIAEKGYDIGFGSCSEEDGRVKYPYSCPELSGLQSRLPIRLLLPILFISL